MEAALQQIREMVTGAKLSTEIQQQILRRLDQLPPLYLGLRRTFESRYREGIAEYVQGILKLLAAKLNDCPDAPEVMTSIVNHLQESQQVHQVPRRRLLRHRVREEELPDVLIRPGSALPGLVAVGTKVGGNLLVVRHDDVLKRLGEG